MTSTKQIDAAAMDNEPLEVKAQFRGTLYVLRAISMTEYDKTVTAATERDEELKEDVFDATKHTRILLGKSLHKPDGMTVTKLYEEDPRLVRGVQKLLTELYWSEEPDELKALQKEEDENGDDEGEAAAAT